MDGGAIARAHGRHEQWGRLVKNAGQAGTYDWDTVPELVR